MLRAILTLGALLGLCYMMAEKDKIPEYTRELNRKTWPVAVVALAVLALMFLT